MQEPFSKDLLNVNRETISGMHQPEGQTMWSVNNSTDDEYVNEICNCKQDDCTCKLKVVESILDDAFRKNAIGLFDIPASTGIFNEDGETGEVLVFDGIHQNPGLSMEGGDDEDTDLFGAKDEAFDLPPQTKFLETIKGCSMNSEDRKSIRKRVASIFGNLVFPYIPTAHLQSFFSKNVSDKDAIERQNNIVLGLMDKLSSSDVNDEEIILLRDGKLKPEELPARMLSRGVKFKFNQKESIVMFAGAYIKQASKLKEMLDSAAKKAEKDALVNDKSSDTAHSDMLTVDTKKPTQAVGRITRAGDPYTYDKNPNGDGYIVVSTPPGMEHVVGRVLLPGTSAYDLVRAADPSVDISEYTSDTSVSQEVLEQKPNLTQLDRAIMAYKNKEYDQAIPMFINAFRDNKSGETMYMLAMSYYNSGDVSSSLDTFYQYSKDYPDLYEKNVLSGIVPASIVDNIMKLTSRKVDESVAKTNKDEAKTSKEIVVSLEKQDELKRYFKNIFDDGWSEQYDRYMGLLRAGAFNVRVFPEKPDGRSIGLIDLGERLPREIRYDGIYYDDKRNSWVMGSLTRSEFRKIKPYLQKDERREVRREMREAKRSSSRASRMSKLSKINKS